MVDPENRPRGQSTKTEQQLPSLVEAPAIAKGFAGKSGTVERNVSCFVSDNQGRDHFTRAGAGGGPVANVSKRYFSWTDTYGIDIADGEDDVTLLASIIVIDLCCHGDKKRH